MGIVGATIVAMGVLLASRPHPPGTNAFLIHFVDVLSALSIPGALLSFPFWLLFPRVYDVSSGSVDRRGPR